MIKHRVVAILLLLFIANNIVAQIPAGTIPEFTFYRFNQTAFTNKDLPTGKMIFIVFFDPDCDHCQHAITTIGQQYKAFTKTAVYLISMFDQNKMNHFMDTYGKALKEQKNVVLLLDKLGQFINKFKPKKYPSMFLYSPEKKLLLYEDDPANIPKFIKAIAAK